MTQPLPQRPSLSSLKHQAKQILKSHKSGDSSVCESLRAHPKLIGMSDSEILGADLLLVDSQFGLAVYGLGHVDAVDDVIAYLFDIVLIVVSGDVSEVSYALTALNISSKQPASSRFAECNVSRPEAYPGMALRKVVLLLSFASRTHARTRYPHLEASVQPSHR